MVRLVMWNSINHLLGRQRTMSHSDCDLDADTMATCFKHKVDDVRSTTANAGEPTYSTIDGHCRFSSFQSIDEQSVLKLILATPAKTSPLDTLPMWLLKKCAVEVTPLITKLFNKSLSDGAVPVGFKDAIVTPRLKKPGLDSNDSNNYRPISNLATLGKLLERIVASQITTYLCQNSLFPELQSAYRQHRSTKTALIKVVNDIIRALDTGNVALMSLLDMSSAFDTVDHNILLTRLEISFGFNSTALNWLKSYLSNRTQSIRFHNKTSKSEIIGCGVPQGSVLGPLLFVLYTADLEKLIRSNGLSVHTYADDIQQCGHCQPSDSSVLKLSMIETVHRVAHWMTVNRLRLNTIKTECMWCATKRRKHLLDRDSINLSGVTIIPSTSVRYLGVQLTSDMSMSSHINKLVSNCFYKLRQLKTCRRSLPTAVAAALVNSFVVSKIDYCNSLFAGQPDYVTDRLQLALNAAARLVYRLAKHDHITETMRDKLHWLRARERITFKLCLLVYKATHGMSPQYIIDMCQPVGTVEPRRRLRSAAAGNLLVPKWNSEFGRRAFSIAAIESWYSLPSAVKTATSISSFKSSLKTYLFNLSYAL